jgi:hypothetical protein
MAKSHFSCQICVKLEFSRQMFEKYQSNKFHEIPSMSTDGQTNMTKLILNVHGVSGVRQAEIHTAEPLVPEPSALEFELAIENLKSHKSPGIDKNQQK